MNTTENVAEVIKTWFEEYASVYEFDGRKEFEDFSLEDMKSVDVEQLWDSVAPTLKKLVAEYVEAQIEELDEN